ncbi:glycosyl transferase [Acetomicrobium mobile DSM 13181]|uniref:Glycosyl transferase n=1 Tax=Acetomicrobium mobile (strain ATCC BAA-54 / DSM 13181 / JCM 12221 / NGA) TaxID=891968 RepID=I4BYW3_ACEMN|nr:glycosyltransferase family 2 protein [Acetomicrobium mobile]AFM22470.1 glycosyl transferase [Acetomicrobium mobile DSM 13181]
MTNDKKVWGNLISIVIPIKDEEPNILPLADEIEEVFSDVKWNWECLWVDDGSVDGSVQVLRKLSNDRPRHRVISFAANAGQSAALWCGCRAAKGDIIATLDGDGQNDPHDIPKLVALVASGKCDMANGYRQNRKDNWVRRISSRIANGFRNAMTGKTVRDVGCSTRAFRKECVPYFLPFKGMHRFIPTLTMIYGFTIAEVPVNHRPRTRGKTKYSIWNRLWVGIFDTFGILWIRKRAFRVKLREDK